MQLTPIGQRDQGIQIAQPVQPAQAESSTSSKKVTLSIAREGESLLDFRKLVYEQYAKRGWLDMSQYPNGIVTDEFDTTSDALVIRSNEEIVAGMRIVRDGGNGFPHEEELQITKLITEAAQGSDALKLLARTPRSRMAEITKVVGKKRQRMLTFDIIKCLYWYAKTSGVDLYVMVIDMDFFVLCDTLGIPISPVGTPVYCEGSWTIPAITQPSRYEREISKKSPQGWSYIAIPDNLDTTWTVH
ncbi:MAG: hypothetical protein K9M10_03775 [Candidatus Pacebacteria bacterium]|nr:hypothetical protein [Candidatus Paceibacterota bacterium]MCF7857571.1 hypothetical protein [Candidatus Paceibacterota bacterium]